MGQGGKEGDSVGYDKKHVASVMLWGETYIDGYNNGVSWDPFSYCLNSILCRIGRGLALMVQNSHNRLLSALANCTISPARQ